MEGKEGEGKIRDRRKKERKVEKYLFEALQKTMQISVNTDYLWWCAIKDT